MMIVSWALRCLNMNQLRTAFVTGASRGIGRAVAGDLARAGYRVVAAARDEERLKSLVEEGGAAAWLPIDLSSHESIKAAFAQAGQVDVLVNNAGITRDGLAIRMKKDDWNSVLATNLTGAFLCIQEVLRGMMKQQWGRIINISSVVGESGNPGQANYVSSKAGLIGLTKSLAQELGSRNITVNAITPGFIETDMSAVLKEEVKQKMLASIPLGRFGKPEDVAAAVRFLASDESGYITGSVLRVNGGMYM
jgi:3-oxoacyl-[acyl-carrier protein] reductase